jgi:hypothetical protein
VVITIATVASFAWCVSVREHRPPIRALGAATPVVLLALIPFAAAGRGGILGVAVDNDMSLHLAFVEALKSKAVEQVTPLQAAYPLGPHSVTAALSTILDGRVDLVFTGVTFAFPVLTAWTALHAVRSASWLGELLVATVVGMPYLVASYYGEGSFKEVLLAQLVLAIALWLDRPVPAKGRWEWVPIALLLAGTVAVYSGPGLLWAVAIIGPWLIVKAAIRIRHDGARLSAAKFRGRLGWVAFAPTAFLVLMVPALPQLKHSLSLYHDRSALGNLAHALNAWEAFGVWSNPDFRFGEAGFHWWTAFVVVLVVWGTVWSIRQGRWVLPLAAGASSLIWVYATKFESPWLSAKALVVISPLLLLLAALPLAESTRRAVTGWWAISSLVLLVLVARVADSDVGALRASYVGPTDHLVQLRALRGELHGEPTLFLGNDDFIVWELAGVPVTTGVLNLATDGRLMAQSPEKPWSYGMALDIDSTTAEMMNATKWLITTRDAAQSVLPAQFHLVRSTADFQLWRRNGIVSPRHTLGEGEGPGVVFNCQSDAGRARLRAGGIAEIRKPPVTVPVGGILPGGTITVQLPLNPGLWDLGTPYQSSHPVIVSGPSGVMRRLPANLDRPGPRWPIGRIKVSRPGGVTLTLHVTRTWLTPGWPPADIGAIVATPVATAHVVPLRAACGLYVDWYRSLARAGR